jgi:Ser/Thr protein kinase RdoA (MazF antagonist)
VVVEAWAELRGLPVAPAEDAGLINETFVVGIPPAYVLQRVNAMFSVRVQEDIEAVTSWLAAQGLPTPRLVRTTTGALQDERPDGVWRVLTFIPGVTHHRIARASLAEAAGALVARFHRAVDTLEWAYRNVRPGAHDTPAHMARLAAVSPRMDGPAAALAAQILEAWRTIGPLPATPPRHAHGDLKISNLRFTPDGDGICLLDLDTLALHPLEVELGDALRSWCNPAGEDNPAPTFDVALLGAAMEGYQRVRRLTPEERAAIVPGTERIALELASRFCRDVAEDRYFGWDRARFVSRAAHNLHRATGQYHLAQDLRARRAEAERAVAG